MAASAATKKPPLSIDELLALPEVQAGFPKNMRLVTTLAFCAKGQHNMCYHEVPTIANNTWVCDCKCHPVPKKGRG
jgi:hypothetical protein